MNQHTPEAKHEHVASEEKKTHEKTEELAKPVAHDKKTPAKVIVKKEEAIAVGHSLPISLKHSMYISAFIKSRSIDNAIAVLTDVIGLRRAIPFKGEIPHRKGQGMMSGRYPESASKEFIRVLKNLKGNAIANGLDLENTRVYFSSPSWAARPVRRGGRKGKRVNLTLKAKEMKKETKTNG